MPRGKRGGVKTKQRLAMKQAAQKAFMKAAAAATQDQPKGDGEKKSGLLPKPVYIPRPLMESGIYRNMVPPFTVDSMRIKWKWSVRIYPATPQDAVMSGLMEMNKIEDSFYYHPSRNDHKGILEMCVRGTGDLQVVMLRILRYSFYHEYITVELLRRQTAGAKKRISRDDLKTLEGPAATTTTTTTTSADELNVSNTDSVADMSKLESSNTEGKETKAEGDDTETGNATDDKKAGQETENQEEKMETQDQLENSGEKIQEKEEKNEEKKESEEGEKKETEGDQEAGATSETQSEKKDGAEADKKSAKMMRGAPASEKWKHVIWTDIRETATFTVNLKKVQNLRFTPDVRGPMSDRSVYIGAMPKITSDEMLKCMFPMANGIHFKGMGDVNTRHCFIETCTHQNAAAFCWAYTGLLINGQKTKLSANDTALLLLNEDGNKGKKNATTAKPAAGDEKSQEESGGEGKGEGEEKMVTEEGEQKEAEKNEDEEGKGADEETEEEEEEAKKNEDEEEEKREDDEKSEESNRKRKFDPEDKRRKQEIKAKKVKRRRRQHLQEIQREWLGAKRPRVAAPMDMGLMMGRGPMGPGPMGGGPMGGGRGRGRGRGGPMFRGGPGGAGLMQPPVQPMLHLQDKIAGLMQLQNQLELTIHSQQSEVVKQQQQLRALTVELGEHHQKGPVLKTGGATPFSPSRTQFSPGRSVGDNSQPRGRGGKPQGNTDQDQGSNKKNFTGFGNRKYRRDSGSGGGYQSGGSSIGNKSAAGRGQGFWSSPSTFSGASSAGGYSGFDLTTSNFQSKTAATGGFGSGSYGSDTTASSGYGQTSGGSLGQGGGSYGQSGSGFGMGGGGYSAGAGQNTSSGFGLGGSGSYGSSSSFGSATNYNTGANTNYGQTAYPDNTGNFNNNNSTYTYWGSGATSTYGSGSTGNNQYNWPS